MTGARSTYQNRWRMASVESLHFVARRHSTWPLLFVIAGFKSAIFSKHVQSLQLLRDELALQNQQLDLLLIGDVAVATEILAQALSEVIMSLRVVFPEVHQLQGDVTIFFIKCYFPSNIPQNVTLSTSMVQLYYPKFVII